MTLRSGSFAPVAVILGFLTATRKQTFLYPRANVRSRPIAILAGCVASPASAGAGIKPEPKAASTHGSAAAADFAGHLGFA